MAKLNLFIMAMVQRGHRQRGRRTSYSSPVEYMGMGPRSRVTPAGNGDLGISSRERLRFDLSFYYELFNLTPFDSDIVFTKLTYLPPASLHSSGNLFMPQINFFQLFSIYRSIDALNNL